MNLDSDRRLIANCQESQPDLTERINHMITEQSNYVDTRREMLTKNKTFDVKTLPMITPDKLDMSLRKAKYMDSNLGRAHTSN